MLTRGGDCFRSGTFASVGNISGDHGRALHIGGPCALGPARAGGDGVLAGVGQHHELVGEVAADGSGVGFHLPETQRHAGENPVVGVAHGGIASVRSRVVAVEGVGVLHHEFAAAHEAETGAQLVAELGLNLVEVQGELTIGTHFAAQQIRDHFFMRGAEAVVALIAILEAQQLIAEFLPAARLDPQVGGNDHGHERFAGSGGAFISRRTMFLALSSVRSPSGSHV